MVYGHFGTKTRLEQDTSVMPKCSNTSAALQKCIGHFGHAAALVEHLGRATEVSERHFGSSAEVPGVLCHMSGLCSAYITFSRPSQSIKSSHIRLKSDKNVLLLMLQLQMESRVV